TQKEYRIDPDQVHLTGLSMGGAGTYSLAVADPGRWASATIVCGFGDPRQAGKLAKLPTRLFCGDKDSPKLLGSMREIQQALKVAGGDVQYTEYPGIGHNSWDLAYNEPGLFAWMLGRGRRP